jgi:superfamily I DNA and/or RNA helicase
MYREQVAVLREAAGRTRHRLRVDTVDAFEGREEDVVVISLVRSNPHGDLGFLRLPNRLNVAVSRARRLVAVVGDSTTLAKDPLFETLIEAARQAGGLVPAAELERVVPARERSPL